MDSEEEMTEDSEGTMTLKEENIMEADIVGRKSPGWRIPLSIIMGVGWLIFLIMWLFFFAGDYHIYQNIGILLLSILIVALILGIAWIFWALGNMTELEELVMATGGFKTRMILSIAVPIGSLMFLALWLFFMAMDFNIYQNIAVVIVTVLVIGGILGVTWTTGGWKTG